MMFLRSSTVALLLCTLPGCAIVGPTDSESDDLAAVAPQPTGETLPEGTSLEAIFNAAATELDVPATLLKSIGWVETRWQMVEGESEFEGMDPAFGIMALRGDKLDQGAALIGASIDEVSYEPAANIRAAAALLSILGDEFAIDRQDVGAWARPVAEHSGIEDEQGLQHYIHEAVYRTLEEGMITELVTLEPTVVVPKYALMDASNNPGPDYAEAIWRPSPNKSSRPSSFVGNEQMVIIHTCEGSYSGCWSWLKNSSSGVSAHYVVSSTGSEITQLVTESKKAWHIGATYKCSRNSDVKCELNGYGSNNFTIGIEHAGYASQASWDQGLLDSSAALTCDITKDNNIPADPYHIVGHGQLQPYNRVDPGPNWPWGAYIASVNSFCNGNGPVQNPPDPQDPQDPQDPPPAGSVTIVVDSNNGANDSNAYCNVSSSWTGSSNVSGYFNTGYWWRSTGSTADWAEFRAHLSGSKTMKVEAWWSSASDRSTSAPFLVYDGNGQHLDTVIVNQKQDGGHWVELGTYAMTSGWNVVALSRWTTPGAVVVADAVRFTEVP